MSELDYDYILKIGGDRLSLADAQTLHRTAIEINARNMVEIGVAGGCSSMVLGNVATILGGHLWGIDPRPEGRWHTNVKYAGVREYITLIEKASPWVVPENEGIKLPIDYLFIDGNHRSKWTITDYQYWQYYVRPGGLIAFHDWTGAGGYKAQIQRSVAIILETDDLREVARVEGEDKGLIVFEKRG
jgi:predicted O-methyltransferase YrrM